MEQVRRPLYEQIALQIKAAIISGESMLMYGKEAEIKNKR